MGLDLGSTSIKAVIYDLRGNPAAEASTKLPLTFSDKDHPTWCVWLPEDVWRCAKTVISEALQKLSGDGKLRAIAVTGFGMDGLPLDRDGKELYPLISWHCPRTVEQFENVKSIISHEEIFMETMKRPMVIDSIYRILWMKQHEPGILERADKWLLIEDYVNYKLCGVQATDYSMASTVSAMRQDTHDWSDAVLSKLGIPRGLLPKPMQAGTVLGTVLPSVCEETGLDGDVKIVLGGHDYICAAFATGILSENDMMDINGTWEMLVGGVPKISKTVWTEDYYYIEGHVAKNSYCSIASCISGDMMEWMKDNFGDMRGGSDGKDKSGTNAAIWDGLMAKAERMEIGAHGCTFLPHFSGSNAPRVEPTSLGAFVGMNNRVTVGDIIRAVVEGLSYKTREMLNSICASTGADITALKAVGGATKNQFWMQVKSDILGIPVETPSMYEATPLGAALLAGIGAGVYSDDADAIQSVYKAGGVYEPDMKKHERYSDLYENIYMKMQSSLTEVNGEIFERFVR
jgi:xylulokinase